MVGFYQIFYEDQQLEKLFPFAIPHKNETLTPFFENSVICDLVSGTEYSKIAVCSWKLKDKMATNYPPCRKLTEEILESDYDVLSLTKNSPEHGMLTIANTWHPNFSAILRRILAIIGFSLPQEVKYPIYQNAFCARSEIYRSYVREMLIPAMEVMGNDEDTKKLCWTDSGYYRLRQNIVFQERVKKFLGVDYCPMHPFICERLFSIWLEDKKLKIEYL